VKSFQIKRFYRSPEQDLWAGNVGRSYAATAAGGCQTFDSVTRVPDGIGDEEFNFQASVTVKLDGQECDLTGGAQVAAQVSRTDLQH
jgi:hypothetical protein